MHRERSRGACAHGVQLRGERKSASLTAAMPKMNSDRPSLARMVSLAIRNHPLPCDHLSLSLVVVSPVRALVVDERANRRGACVSSVLARV